MEEKGKGKNVRKRTKTKKKKENAVFTEIMIILQENVQTNRESCTHVSITVLWDLT